jgi:Trk K+ transport system NAD-binding subunit
VLVEGESFNVGLLIFVIFEILLDIVLGILIGWLLSLIMRVPVDLLKSGLILLLGLSVFLLSTELHDFHLFSLPVGIFSEPLLICMTAGFFVTNYTKRAPDFRHLVEGMSPFVFLLFFTLVGIELELNVIGEAWVIILILFAVRLVGIFIGTFAGTLAARGRSPGTAWLGLGFITQAGVSVGLAKEIGVEFSEWGSELATLSIGVIVLNQIIGPPILKWVINRVGEARTRGQVADFDGIRDVVIFGLNRQSVQLALHLGAHDWQVKLVYLHPEALENLDVGQVDIHHLSEISAAALSNLDLAQADAVVTFLPDEESFQLCEIVYEQFGIGTMVALLDDRANFERFYELGVKVVEPQTAVVSLLEHFVRAPVGASLLLGMDGDQDVVDIKVLNPDLDRVRIRELHLPLDVLVLSVGRGERTIISHGYTRIRFGDKVTVVGSAEKLAEVMLRLEG